MRQAVVRAKRVGIIALVYFCTAGIAPAEVLECLGIATTIDAEHEEDAHAACSIVAELLPRLTACHLPQTGPILGRTADALKHMDVPVLGTFNRRSDTFSVISSVRLRAAIDPENPLVALPIETIFRSLVAHELAHALIAQQSNDMHSTADQEYIAYAMQMETLGAEGRAEILRRTPGDTPVDTTRLNGFVALARPYRFAALVWRHFRTPGNGCDFVGRLVRGETTLALPPL